MKYTKKRLLKELKEIEKLMDEADGSPLDSVLALDYLLRLPDSDQLFDDTTKNYAKKIWSVAVNMGVKLDTPPVIAASEEIN